MPSFDEGISALRSDPNTFRPVHPNGVGTLASLDPYNQMARTRTPKWRGYPDKARPVHPNGAGTLTSLDPYTQMAR
eukprot:1369415-Pyramimonas_sp.AAC.1